MPDVPIDALWIALPVASLVALALAVEVPRDPSPDAVAVADTIDAVAATSYPTTATHPTGARAIRIEGGWGDAGRGDGGRIEGERTDGGRIEGERTDGGRIDLRGPAGWTGAVLSSGPVLAVGDGPLGRVLAGADPRQVFDSPADLERAVAAVRDRGPIRRSVDGRIRVRKVRTGEVEFTLVGG